MVDQNLQINLVGRDVSATDALRNLARAASQAARSAGDSMDEMNARVRRSSDEASESVTSRFGSGLLSWAQGGLVGILGGVTASITNTVTNALGDAAGAVLNVVKSSAIDYNTLLEIANIGFTTMLGSAGKAQQFLGELQQFARTTPFDFGDLVQLSQQMMGYGIAARDVIPDLTALGDAAAASGKTGSQAISDIVLAFEQMNARGRVDLGDINQLTAGGVPALKILAGAYHTTTGGILQMISTGKLMASDALPKLTAGIEHGTKSTAALGGMMQKQSATFAGAMSNINDGVQQALSKAFLPFFKVVEGIALKLSNFAGSKAVQQWAQNASKVIGEASQGIMRFAGQIFGAIQKIFSDPKVQNSLGDLGKSLGDAFRSIGPALQRMLPDAIKFGENVLPAIIDATTGVVKHVPQMLDVIQKFGHFLAEISPGIASVTMGIGKIASAGMDMSATVDRAIIRLLSAFSGIYNKVMSIFSGAAGWLADAGRNVVQGFIGGIVNSLPSLSSVASDIGGIVKNTVAGVLGIQSPSRVFIEFGRNIGQGLEIGISSRVPTTKSAVSKLAQSVITAAGNVFGRNLGIENTALGIGELRSQSNGIVASTRSATIGAGNLLNYAATGDAVQGLESLVRNTNRFKNDLKTLSRRGIDDSTFEQLVQGWNSDPATALRVADQLLANPNDMREIVRLQQQVALAGTSLGLNEAGNYSQRIIAQTRGLARAEARQPLNVTINLTGVYAGDKNTLVKEIRQMFLNARKQGVIPANALSI